MRLQTSITSGLVVPHAIELRAVLAPLAADLAKCYWLIDAQSGPFRDNLPGQNEAVYDELLVETDACRGTSCSCWRPGTLPRLADQVVVDEWTYLFAMQCDETGVPERAEWLRPRLGKFDADFFAGLPAVADLFVIHADGWWEVYTSREDWQCELRVAFPDAFERSVGEVGLPSKR